MTLLVSSVLAAALPGNSLYHLSSSWRNQDGEAVKIESFRGRPVVLAMAYTGCTYTCPLVVAKVKEIESAMKSKGVADYRIVMASFDTKGDRPKDTKAYMKKKGLDPARWVWLSADDDKTVRELAAALGVTYSKSGKKDFAHSNQITLLDSEGRLAAQINGVNADHAPLLKELSRGSQTP